MDSLLILLPVALLFFALATWLFLWAVGDRQFDDLDKEGQRILFDDDKAASKTRQANPKAAQDNSNNEQDRRHE